MRILLLTCVCNANLIQLVIFINQGKMPHIPFRLADLIGIQYRVRVNYQNQQ